MIDRRTLIAALSAVCIAPKRGWAVTDAAGRAVPVPGHVARVFPAGPPAASAAVNWTTIVLE